jgi:hypothetical protein
MKCSGLKLNFTEDGEVSVKEGKIQLPHRIDLMRQAFEKKEYDSVLEMAYNLSVQDCIHASSRSHIEQENDIVNQTIKSMEETQHAQAPF